MNFKHTLLATALAFAAQASFAQTTLLGAYEAAAAYDAALVAAKANQDVAKEKIIQAKSVLKPTVNLSGSSSRGVSETYNSHVDNTYWSSGITLASTYPIYRPALKTVINQTELSAKLTETALANAQSDLMVRVAQAYFDVLLTQDTLASIAVQKKAIAEQLAQAKREFEVGTKTIVDTNEAQSRFDQVLAQEAVAQGDEVGKRAALATLMGAEPQKLAALIDNPTIGAANPADINAWAERAEQASVSVQNAQIASDIAKLEIERNKLNKKPTADAFFNVNGNRSIRSPGGSTNSTSTSATVGVQFAYSVYNGGNLDSKVRESIAAYGKTLADIDGAKRAVSQAARLAYLSLTYGLAQITALESVRRSSQTLLDSTKLGYQVGVRINLDVLNAQQTLANNAKDIAKARYDSIMAGIRLKAAANQLSEQDMRDASMQMK